MKNLKLGIGTWHIGDDLSKRAEEISSIQYALDHGIKLIDTAEMYGNGRSEALVGEAIKGRKRDDLYLISKVLPGNANKERLEKSLDASLKRLGVDYLDQYLYHWRGATPLAETVAILEKMVQKGKIKSWGVSNFDTDDMEELFTVEGGENCQSNQVLYHLGSRGIDYDLRPLLDKKKIMTIAYCPLAQAGRLREELLSNPVLKDLAKAKGITVYQLLLLFITSQENILPIPKASSLKHMKDNLEVLEMNLSSQEMDLLNREYPKPTHKLPLDVE